VAWAARRGYPALTPEIPRPRPGALWSLLMNDPRSFYHGKKVLVTGGLGCLGSGLTRELVSAGAELTVVDSCHPMFGANEHNLEGVLERVKVNICDIRDADAMNKLVQGQDLLLKQISIDGQILENNTYQIAEEQLIIESVPDDFILVFNKQM
jgi:hypothetical protein